MSTSNFSERDSASSRDGDLAQARLPQPKDIVVVRTPAEAVALARKFERQGRLAEAEQLYRKTIQHEPSNRDAIRGLGLMAYRSGRPSEAVELLGRALSQDRTNADLHNEIGGAFGAMSRHDRAAAAFAEATRLRPDFAEAFGNLGTALQRLGRIDEGLGALKRAAAMKPYSPIVQTQLGAALAKLERHIEAIEAFRAAVAAKPDHAEALGRMGNSLRAVGRHAESLTALREAIRLRPNYPEAHINLGLTYLDQNLATEAVAAFATAIRLKPDYTEAHWNHGLALLMAGDWTHGWTEYEWRRPLRKDPVRRRDAPIPMWDGVADIAGKTVLLHSEQGFGDTIMFVRFAAALAERGGNVVLQARPELKRLCSSVPWVANVISTGDPIPHLDYHVHLMSLPAILGTTPDTIPGSVPYLRSDSALLEQWQARLSEDGAPIRIGIAWGCNPKPLPTRACPLSFWKPLSAVAGAPLYALQKGEPAKEIAQASPDMRLVDHTKDLNDFADTAAFIANLDVVITVDTSVAHVAGGLGVPVWILLPYVSDWRWMLGREETPWYPTARLFRQREPGDWDGVMKRVATELATLVASRQSAVTSSLQASVELSLSPRDLIDRLAEYTMRVDTGESAAITARDALAAAADPLLAADADLRDRLESLRELHATVRKLSSGDAEGVLAQALRRRDELRR
jgi:tetratricopeptide (TPR) repeat protein